MPRSISRRAIKMKLLLLWVILSSHVQAVYCFCGDPTLHGNLTEAVVQVSDWLREHHHTSSIPMEPHMTSFMMVSLRLAGHRPRTLLSDFNTNQSFTMIDTLKTHFDNHQRQYNSLSMIPAGQMAYFVQGVLALCLHPKDFYGHDLTKPLRDRVKTFGKITCDNFFEYSMAALALCHCEDIIGKMLAKKVVLELEKARRRLSVRYPKMPDSTALALMSLSCLRQRDGYSIEVRGRIDRLILKYLMTIHAMRRHQYRSWNVHSTSLVVQAMTALPTHLKPRHWHCKKLMQRILEEQDETGSFGNVLANIQVLPALLGRSPVNLRDLSCPRDSLNSEEEKRKISICVKLEFQDQQHMAPAPVKLTVPERTTAFEILHLAAQKSHAFRYEVKNTSFGRMVTAISGVEQDTKTGSYWALYSSVNTLAADGVDIFTPKNNSCIIFKYEKCSQDQDNHVENNLAL